MSEQTTEVAQDDAWAWWRRALAEPGLELPSRAPQIGYYRTRDDRPVAVWRDKMGDIVACVGTDLAKTVEADDAWCERVFSSACKRPVEYAAYQTRIKEGAWPEAVPMPTRNAQAMPEIQLKETLADLLAEAKAWAENIGTVETQEQADKAANYAQRFRELAVEADEKHKVAKAPHLKAGREVDETWKPIERDAQTAQRWAASLNTSFLTAEKAKRLREAAATVESGGTVARSATTVKAGSRGVGVRLVTKKTGTITDYDVFYAAVKDRTWVREKMAEFAVFLAVTKGADIPAGMKIEERQEAR